MKSPRFLGKKYRVANLKRINLRVQNGRRYPLVIMITTVLTTSPERCRHKDEDTARRVGVNALLYRYLPFI